MIITMSRIKAVFWDMDGTLYDNECIYEETIKTLLEKYNLTMPVESSIGKCLRSFWDSILENNQTTLTYENWAHEVISLCSQTLNKNHIRPGVQETLHAVFEAKILQSCVSNSERLAIENNLDATGLASYFNNLIGRDDVNQGKPAPDPYLMACVLNKVDPQQCIAIEDSEVGVLSAKRAGVFVIAHPNNMTAHLDFSHADLIVDRPTEILKLINQ